jgi:hypothetical protein
LEWESAERDAWVSDAQRWICQINGVLQCKIDLDDAGEITGVHVVTGMERDPRLIVRDVEGLLKARMDLDVYYKKIGVVQVLDNGHGAKPAPAAEVAASAESGVTFQSPRDGRPAQGNLLVEPAADPVPSARNSPGPVRPSTHPRHGAAASETPDRVPQPIPAILVAEDLGVRVVCGSVGVMASDTVISAEVHLRAGNVEARGQREGLNHADSELLLVAQAAVAAVRELIADPVLLHLREVRLDEVGGQTVVLCAVDLVEGRQSTTLFGTCSTRHNRQQAVVYAVLDALNRRLALHGLKTLAGAD